MKEKLLHYLWPRSLYGQILLAVALALFLAQSINAALLLASVRNRAMAESATLLIGRINTYVERQSDQGAKSQKPKQKRNKRRPPAIAVIEGSAPLTLTDYSRRPDLEGRAREFLDNADTGLTEIRFSSGPLQSLPDTLRDGPMHRPFVVRLAREGRKLPREAIILSVRTQDGTWLNAANLVRPREFGSIVAMLFQTLLIYIVVMVPLALIARRIANPLARLTNRVERVGLGDDVAPLVSEGPSDVRHLINSFNGMQARVANLLGEKDIMLGAIGHDLKTPLASLRVRIESVEDENDRQKMIGSIDEMVTILDDILMLARLGKSGETLQVSDIGALVEAVAEDFETTGADITITLPSTRLVASVRPTLIRRALRNVIDNALIYGKSAAISFEQMGTRLRIFIDDDGPGITSDKIEQMFEPFVRAEGSRNRETGGSGLGLTIARAIARSHNGDLTLANRALGGLRAVIELPAGG